MDYIFLIVFFCMTLLDYYFLSNMLTSVFGRPKSEVKKKIIYSVLILTSLSLMKVNYINTIFTALFIIFLMPIYPKNLKKKAFIYLNINIIVMAMQDIQRELYFVIGNGSSYFRLMYYIVYHIAFWYIMMFISKVCVYRKEAIELNKKVVLSMMAYPILIMIWDTGYGFYISDNINEKIVESLIYNIGFSSWIIMIFIGLLLIYMYGLIEKQFIEEREKTILENEFFLKQRHYKEIENMQFQIRSIKHDMKNQINTALYLLKKEDIDGAKEILDIQNDEITKAEDVLFTGNSAIDSVLNIKGIEAKKNNISISYNMMVPKNMKLNYGYMVIILGNILDNAIEANLKIEENRYITASVKYVNGMLVGRFENPYYEDIHGLKDESTSKEDKINHGYGINNIKQAVYSMGGDVSIEKKDNKFSITFILYKIEVE